MSDQRITNANEIRSDRYEIEPRPLPVGGGWRIRFFGKDLETGQEIEMGGGVFPVENGQDERRLRRGRADRPGVVTGSGG